MGEAAVALDMVPPGDRHVVPDVRQLLAGDSIHAIVNVGESESILTLLVARAVGNGAPATNAAMVPSSPITLSNLGRVWNTNGICVITDLLQLKIPIVTSGSLAAETIEPTRIAGPDRMSSLRKLRSGSMGITAVRGTMGHH